MKTHSAGSRFVGDRDLARAVIDAVASAEGVGAEELEPLTRAVDPDALNALFAGPTGTTGKVVFRYHGYLVTAHGDGRVALDDPPEP